MELSSRQKTMCAIGTVLGTGIVAYMLIHATSSSGHSKTARSNSSTSDVPTVASAIPSGPTTTSAAQDSTEHNNFGETNANRNASPESQTFRTPLHCTASGNPRTGTVPGNDPNTGRQWVTVQQLSGACDGNSARFHLSGIDTRLLWRSDATSFNAFVVDAQHGLDATAGYPDASCTGPCADAQSLVDGPGDFSLRVQADGGPWQVLVQQYQ